MEETIHVCLTRSFVGHCGSTQAGIRVTQEERKKFDEIASRLQRNGTPDHQEFVLDACLGPAAFGVSEPGFAGIGR
jgi:hypothetical protein